MTTEICFFALKGKKEKVLNRIRVKPQSSDYDMLLVLEVENHQIHHHNTTVPSTVPLHSSVIQYFFSVSDTLHVSKQQTNIVALQRFRCRLFVLRFLSLKDRIVNVGCPDITDQRHI